MLFVGVPVGRWIQKETMLAACVKNSSLLDEDKNKYLYKRTM